ncbi:hypothetical protein GF337_05150 [candidate division KSB1 bacterium]|nr:hypothetical protein [candidate division KSB1 bacterium]
MFKKFQIAMKKYLLTLICMLCLISSELTAQGMTRSTGLGMRLGFWNITNHPTRIKSSGLGESMTVDIGGVGAWLTFFSRLKHNWFMEVNLGALAGVHTEQSNYVVRNVESSTIVPVLFGIRRGILSGRFSSSIQPYLSAGVGPYWSASIKTEGEPMFGEQEIDSKLYYGAYGGGGVHLVLASWFALNFGLRYHFVDFEFEKGYSGLEFSTGFSVMWGSKQEIFQIKDIKVVVNDLYPAYYRFYNTYPLALITIKNVAGYPIEVNVKSRINGFSERVQNSGFVKIGNGTSRDIPVTVIFGQNLMQINQRKPAILDIEVEARAGKITTKSVSAQIMVHNKNAWNGDMDKLGMFITSEDEEILNFSRKVASQIKTDTPAVRADFLKAKILFEELGKKGIRYHRDPNIPFYQDDRVQFAMETLEQKSGDCDDLVVLYASLLESLGIETAFIEVRDPQKDIAHLYLIFDSGVSPADGYHISENEKRYIIRENPQGKASIWVPVETTLVGENFESAWNAGAMAYLEEGLIRNGIAAGWVKIIDID